MWERAFFSDIEKEISFQLKMQYLDFCISYREYVKNTAIENDRPEVAVDDTIIFYDELTDKKLYFKFREFIGPSSLESEILDLCLTVNEFKTLFDNEKDDEEEIKKQAEYIYKTWILGGGKKEKIFMDTGYIEDILIRIENNNIKKDMFNPINDELEKLMQEIYYDFLNYLEHKKTKETCCM